MLIRLAEPIRRIAAMSNEGASCENIGLTVAESIVCLMPGVRVLVLSMHADCSVATVISARNEPQLQGGEQFDVPGNPALSRSAAAIGTVVCSPFDADNPLFAGVGMDNSASEVLLTRTDRRSDGSKLVVAIVTGSDEVEGASAVLNAMGELLCALCAGVAATQMRDESVGAIERAKREWERTVDSLPEIVLLLDEQGCVLRANRTVERWQLCDVTQVRGMPAHRVLHADCSLAHCALRDAMSPQLAAQAPNGFLETTLTDPQLGRTVIVHAKPMQNTGSPRGDAPTAKSLVVVSDITDLHDAQQALEQMNADLESRVEERTQELEQSNTELAEEVSRRRVAEFDLQWSRDELAELSKQLIEAQEDERRRLSRELHDSLGQTLGAIKYSLERIAAMHEGGESDETQADIEKVIESITHAIRETRTLALDLRPPVLDDIGTASAITYLCKSFAETYEEIAFHIEMDVGNDEIPAELAAPVYRITQEALSNVAKHAQAKTALVSLQLHDEVLQLQILDDGIGFNNETADTGQFRRLGKVGRLGMRERAASTKGKLEIRSGQGQGTRVLATWDLGRIS
jgi:signal transduction histidine kinase